MIAITIVLVLVAVIIGYIIGKHKEQKHYTLYTYYYYQTYPNGETIKEYVTTFNKAKLIRSNTDLEYYYIIKEYDSYFNFTGLKTIPMKDMCFIDKTEGQVK